MVKNVIDIQEYKEKKKQNINDILNDIDTISYRMTKFTKNLSDIDKTRTIKIIKQDDMTDEELDIILDLYIEYHDGSIYRDDEIIGNILGRKGSGLVTILIHDKELLENKYIDFKIILKENIFERKRIERFEMIIKEK